MEEEWRDVVGYEGFYKVSSYGRVLSLHKKSKISKREMSILTPKLTREGYYHVTLYGNGTRRNKTVHRLVAMAFLPNPNNYEYVNHKDECKTNNCVDNLEWCTMTYNNSYGTARLRSSLSKGKPVAQMIGNVVVAKYRNMQMAADILGIKSSHSIAMACRHHYKCNGFLWKIIENDDEFDDIKIEDIII